MAHTPEPHENARNVKLDGPDPSTSLRETLPITVGLIFRYYTPLVCRTVGFKLGSGLRSVPRLHTPWCRMERHLVVGHKVNGFNDIDFPPVGPFLVCTQRPKGRPHLGTRRDGIIATGRTNDDETY